MYHKIEAFKHKFQMAYNRYSLERQIFFFFFFRYATNSVLTRIFLISLFNAVYITRSF